MKLAGAPISWGVCEVPGWGLQLPAARVLAEMAELGLEATEAGPPGFLPVDSAAARELLGRHGLRLIAAFATAVLHLREPLERELAAVTAQAEWIAACGGEVVVLAAASGREGYSDPPRLDDRGWRFLFDAIDRVADIAAGYGLSLAVHPHWGTAIERRDHVERFLGSSPHGLCLDTGHLVLGGADPHEIARTAAGRVRHVHLKDVDGRLASEVRSGSLDYAAAVRRGLFRPLGRGVARIADVLGLLRSRGYEGWHVLEQDVMLDGPPERIPERIRESVSYARLHG